MKTITDSRTTARFTNRVQSRLSANLMIPLLLSILAIFLVSVSLPGIDLRKMSDLGLISVLPPGIFLSLALIQISFFYTITRPSLRTEVLIFNIIILIFMLTSLTLPIREVPRFSVTWRHAGIVEYIMRLGKVDPRIDAYFNWPIFFAIGAFLTQLTGLTSILPLVDWAPLLYNLLYLAPLLYLYDTATQDRRHAWLAVWLFYLFNWIGQDYFSPQGLDIFLYLVCLAVFLRWLAKSQFGDQSIPEFYRLGRFASFIRVIYVRIIDTGNASETTKAQRRVLLTILMLVFTLMVSSHQLTPLAFIIGVSLLALFNRIQYRFIPIIMIIIVLAWLAFPANAFIKTRALQLIDDMGQLDSAVNASVLSRLSGSPGHGFVIHARLVYTLLFWVLGLAGGLVRVIKGYKDTDFILLTVAPFLLIAVLLYGGEMLMRVYLFSLPFMAFFVASLFWQVLMPDKNFWRSMIMAVSLIGFSFGFFLVRYGNERMDQFTLNEWNAVRYVYANAQPGALISTVAKNLPYKYENYEKYRYVSLEVETVSLDIQAILNRMSEPIYPEAYLILTRSQAANLEMFYNFQAQSWEKFVNLLKDSDRYQLVYENEDSLVFKLLNP